MMSRALVRPILIGAGLAALLVTTSVGLFWWFVPAETDAILATHDAAAAIAAPTATVTTTTTVTATSTPTPPTTEPDPGPTFDTMVCVVGLDPGGVVPVLVGPSVEYSRTTEIPYDGVDVGLVGNSAVDSDGADWVEVHHRDTSGWALRSAFTAGPCTAEPIVAYSVTGIPCRSDLNVRNGIGGRFARLGTLRPADSSVPGTGYSAIDEQERRWVRVEFEDRIAWVAGWFLTDEPLDPERCS